MSIHTSPCCLHITERKWLRTSQNPEMFHPCAWGCETGGAAELGFLHFLDFLAVGEAPLHTCSTYNFKIGLHFMNCSKFLQQDCSGNSTFLTYYAVSTRKKLLPFPRWVLPSSSWWGFKKTLVQWCNIPLDLNVHQNHCENMKSCRIDL